MFVLKQFFKMFVQQVILPAIYKFYSRRPINENLVLFADAQHDEVPFSMRKIYETVTEMDVEVVHFFQRNSELSMMRLIRSMMQFMKCYAVAKYVFICDYYLPVASCNKREGTYVVQLWHAGGQMKKFGYDTEDDIPSFYKGNVFRNYNLITASSEAFAVSMQSAMKAPDGVAKPTGMSRTDCYFDTNYLKQCREQFYHRYPEAQGKKIVMWAPTFRGKAADPYLAGEQAVMDLQKQLGLDWYVVIKVHPHLDKKMKISNCDLPSEEVLPVVDLMISDYSSILYDYLIFQKPFVLYAPDLDQYRAQRGLYIDYECLPGQIVTMPSELLEAVINADSLCDREALAACYREQMGACDGCSTERILKNINLC